VKEHNPHPLFAGGLGSVFHKNKGGDCGTGTAGNPGCATCGGQPGGYASQPYPQATPHNPYQPNAGGYPGYGYGYNPYAAAAGAYYGPYLTQPTPGVMPAGQYR